MMNDVEYKTAFRWSTFSIYCQIISLGAWSDGKSLDKDIPGMTQIITYFGRMAGMILPYIGNKSLSDATTMYFRVYGSGTTLKIRCQGGSDYNQNTYICVFYCKND